MRVDCDGYCLDAQAGGTHRKKVTTGTMSQGEAVRGRPANGGKNSASVEIELKLIVGPDDLAALATSRAIERYARNSGVTRNLRSVYYDTSERKLWNAGWTLRVRKTGSRYVMTVKSLSAAGGGVIGRGEWEVEVATMEPDLSALPEDVPQAFRETIEAADLAPVLSTQVKRRARKLDLPDACIELAVDAGEVVAGERREALSEIELELVSGRVGALYDVALELLDLAPVEMSLYSKAARGFDLTLDRPPGFKKPAGANLPSGVDLDDAFSGMLGTALRHFIENRPPALDGRHPEGVHQVRVALRRLRSILNVIHKATGSTEAAAFGQEAKWIAGEQGDARNWDVFIGQTVPPIAAGCPDAAGFDLLVRQAGDERKKAYDRSRAALADMRALRFSLALARWIEARGWRDESHVDVLELLGQPASGYASGVLDRQFRKVLKRGRKFAKLKPEKRHELRLAVKKLRYLTDFLLPLCAKSKKAAPFAKALSRLQDGLGRYNDIATTDLLLGGLAAPDRPPGFHRACGIIHGWQARDLTIVEDELRARWKDFSNQKVPWSH